jgi:hypothetical protein
MTFFEHTERWFKGEASEGGMLVIFGSMLGGVPEFWTEQG